MAVLGCNFCSGKFEVAITEPWLCGCGAGWWGIYVDQYSPDEIKNAMQALHEIRTKIQTRCNCAAMPFSLPTDGNFGIEGAPDYDKAKSFEAYIDTLLLFFPSILLSNTTTQELVELLGHRKLADYHDAGLIRTVCTHDGPINEEFDFDLLRLSPAERAHEPYWIQSNLASLYAHEMIKVLIDTGLIKSKRCSDGRFIQLGQYKYYIDALIQVLPGALCRSEVTAYLLGATSITDSFYGVIHRLRELRYSVEGSREPREADLFYHWVRSRQLSTAKLDSRAVLEFRAKYGTLQPFLSEVHREMEQNIEYSKFKDLRECFTAELDNRVRHAKKVLAKGHDVKAMYLTGLFSTFGSLAGGATGAFIGGIGGRVVSQLALEYDRTIPGPLSFIAEVIE